MLKRMRNGLDSVVAAIEVVGARFFCGVLVGATVGWLLATVSGEATVGYATGVAVGSLVFVGALIVGIASRLAQRRSRSDSDEQPAV